MFVFFGHKKSWLQNVLEPSSVKMRFLLNLSQNMHSRQFRCVYCKWKWRRRRIVWQGDKRFSFFTVFLCGLMQSWSFYLHTLPLICVVYILYTYGNIYMNIYEYVYVCINCVKRKTSTESWLGTCRLLWRGRWYRKGIQQCTCTCTSTHCWNHT